MVWGALSPPPLLVSPVVRGVWLSPAWLRATACLLAGGGVAMVDALMERFPIRFDPQIEGCFFHMWGKHLTPTLILCLLRFSLSSISVMENEAFFLFCFFNVHRLMGNHSRSAPFTTEHHHWQPQGECVCFLCSHLSSLTKLCDSHLFLSLLCLFCSLFLFYILLRKSKDHCPTRQLPSDWRYSEGRQGHLYLQSLNKRPPCI